MTEKDPLVSVVMSVYNGHIKLSETIDSVLSQTLENFEFILIDDGSTDCALEILKEYKEKDPRVLLIQNGENLGLAASLNKGIQIARGEYIARIDADDICLPERFEKQVRFLEQNPSILILGSNITQIDDEGNPIREIRYATDPNELRWNMLFGISGVIAHPCAMIRAQVFREGGFYKLIRSSQDLELWSRYINNSPLPIYNLQESLVKCRWHKNSFSVKFAEMQFQISNQIRLDTLNHLFSQKYDLQTVEAFRTLTSESYFVSIGDKKKLIKNWFEIWQHFEKKFKLSTDEMKPKYEQLYFRIKNWVAIRNYANKDVLRLRDLIQLIGFWKTVDFINYKIKSYLKRKGKRTAAQS